MQLLPKFKRILYMGFNATSNVRKFKVAHYRPVPSDVSLPRGGGG